MCTKLEKVAENSTFWVEPNESCTSFEINWNVVLIFTVFFFTWLHSLSCNAYIPRWDLHQNIGKSFTSCFAFAFYSGADHWSRPAQFSSRITHSWFSWHYLKSRILIEKIIFMVFYTFSFHFRGFYTSALIWVESSPKPVV